MGIALVQIQILQVFNIGELLEKYIGEVFSEKYAGESL